MNKQMTKTERFDLVAKILKQYAPGSEDRDYRFTFY